MIVQLDLVLDYDYYLYTGSNYYTMTPFSFEYDEVAFAFLIDEYGHLSSSYRVTSDLGVKPVISLKADVLKYDAATSNGSMEHPFVVSL